MTEHGFTNPSLEGVTHAGELVRVPLYSQIEGNLWVGAAPRVQAPGHFGLIVNLAPAARYALHRHQFQICAEVYDAPELPDLAVLTRLCGIVTDYLSIGSVLIHCQHGINRSPLLAAMVMIRNYWPPASAIARLREKRCEAVLSNGTFERWLLSLGEKEAGVP